tara:strand:+ start:1178 stop:1801 length:624 start_codon:yes stop_codon:yes gene_type:complete
MINFKDKNILVIGAHQDDETLFCGGLLSNIKDTSNLNIVVVSKPMEGRPDTNTRIQSFKNVCNLLKAKPFQLDFGDTGPNNFEENFNHYQKNGEFKRMVNKISDLIDDVNADFIITHNQVGEYGHCFHKIINRAVTECVEKNNKKCKIIVFDVNLDTIYNKSVIEKMVINYNIDEKIRLFECYMPYWNGIKMYSQFALKPEKYRIYG